MAKKVQGSYTGIYSFDHMLTDEPKHRMAIYTSKNGEGFGTYEFTMEKYIALDKPDKIKVIDTVESIK